MVTSPAAGTREGALVIDEPVVIHCYTTPGEISDTSNLAEVGAFCRRMGRDARQDEIGLMIGDEYFAIRDESALRAACERIGVVLRNAANDDLVVSKQERAEPRRQVCAGSWARGMNRDHGCTSGDPASRTTGVSPSRAASGED